jgi:hypothetical protein
VRVARAVLGGGMLRVSFFGKGEGGGNSAQYAYSDSSSLLGVSFSA